MQKKPFSVLFLQSQHGSEKISALSEPLQQKGYWVDTVERIEQASEFLEQRTYDMFLMDITDISVGECLSLIQMLRDLTTDLIVISDHVDDKWYQKAMNIGVSTIFTKPINPALLENMVDNCKKVKNASPSYLKGC